MNHRQHTDLRDLAINRRAEACYNIALAVFIGCALAAALAAWACA